MFLYETDCPFNWARGIICFQGLYGETDLGLLRDHFREVICQETGKKLPTQVIHLCIVMQSGLPESEDYEYFQNYYPEGAIKEALKDHLDRCRRSRYWGELYWKGWYRTQP